MATFAYLVQEGVMSCLCDLGIAAVKILDDLIVAATN